MSRLITLAASTIMCTLMQTTSMAVEQEQLSDHDCGGEGTIEFDGVSAATVRLDYRGSFLSINTGPGDSTSLYGFDRNNPYMMAGQRFIFGNEELCTRELISLGFDLEGTNNAEIIVGTNTTNRITGHGGDDVLIGGDGNNTFFYNLGDGRDCISDSGGENTIVFGAGITANRVAVRQVKRGDQKVVLVRLVNSKGQINVTAGMDILDKGNATTKYQFKFGDGSAYDIKMLIYRTSTQQTWTGFPEASNCIFDIAEANASGLIDARKNNPPMPISLTPPPPEPETSQQPETILFPPVYAPCKLILGSDGKLHCAQVDSQRRAQ